MNCVVLINLTTFESVTKKRPSLRKAALLSYQDSNLE